MYVSYDVAKNEANLEKHGISLEEAAEIWLGRVVDIPAKHVDERRIKSIGMLGGRCVSVIRAPRKEVRRIISARYASDKERRIYFDKINKC